VDRAAIRPSDPQAAASTGYHEEGATMNIERIYRTAVPADDLARALAAGHGWG
jgi:hypothetical protein